MKTALDLIKELESSKDKKIKINHNGKEYILTEISDYIDTQSTIEELKESVTNLISEIISRENGKQKIVIDEDLIVKEVLKRVGRSE